MTKATIRKITVKPWQAALIVILIMTTLGVLFGYLLKNETARPIIIESKQLSDVQRASLQQVLKPIGEVQFFSVDLRQIHEAVSKLSWVENVEVSRNWKRGVVVTATARKAVANFGSDRLLDAYGIVYEPADSKQLMNKKLANLYGHTRQSSQIMKKLKQINEWYAPLNVRVQDLILTPRQTWVIRFNNGMRIMVDHENTEQKLYNLALQLQGALSDEFVRIDSVDLRYRNGFAIAWRHQN